MASCHFTATTLSDRLSANTEDEVDGGTTNKDNHQTANLPDENSPSHLQLAVHLLPCCRGATRSLSCHSSPAYTAVSMLLVVPCQTLRDFPPAGVFPSSLLGHLLRLIG